MRFRRIFPLLLLLVVAACDYSQQTARKLLHTSYAAFCTKGLLDWSCQPCALAFNLIQVAPFQSSTEEVYIFSGVDVELKQTTIALRATVQVQMKHSTSMFSEEQVEWKGSANRPCSGCRINKKMKQLALIVQSEFTQVVKKALSGDNNQVVLTSYGFGGGILTLLLAHLTAEAIDVQDFYTFGSPRVGNAAFSQWFNRNYAKGLRTGYRVVHHKDPVSSYGSKKHYRHVRQEVYYDKNEKAKMCSDLQGEDPTCQNSLYLRKWKDHFTYLDTNFHHEIKLCTGKDDTPVEGAKGKK